MTVRALVYPSLAALPALVLALLSRDSGADEMAIKGLTYFDVDGALVRQDRTGALAVLAGRDWVEYRDLSIFEYQRRPISDKEAERVFNARHHFLTGKTLSGRNLRNALTAPVKPFRPSDVHCQQEA